MQGPRPPGLAASAPVSGVGPPPPWTPGTPPILGLGPASRSALRSPANRTKTLSHCFKYFLNFFISNASRKWGSKVQLSHVAAALLSWQGMFQSKSARGLQAYLCLDREPDLLRLDLDGERECLRLSFLSAKTKRRGYHMLSEKKEAVSAMGEAVPLHLPLAAVLLVSPVEATQNSLPGSMAADMRDWASLTLFMASSISLLEASVFIPELRFSPAAIGFNLQSTRRQFVTMSEVTRKSTVCGIAQIG